MSRKGTLLLFPQLVSGILYLMVEKLLVQCISDVSQRIGVTYSSSWINVVSFIVVSF